MLHQVVPHYHHFTETDHADQHAVATEHSHGNQHHDNNSRQGEKPFDFLAFLLGGHINLPTTTETPTFQQNIVEDNQTHQIIVTSNTAKNTVLKWPSKDPLIYQAPDLYFKLYVSNLSLRGPPTLI